MSAAPQLGPVLLGTVLCSDIGACLSAYTRYLHAHYMERDVVSNRRAHAWGAPELAGCTMAVLANAFGRPWLRLIEYANAKPRDHLHSRGWMALEVIVEDVDAIATSLRNSPFEILRPVADLSMSDNIRAVQVRGPAGEILYLTQIKAPVPPFELPMATCPVDRLFIPVLSSADRDVSLDFYENLAEHKGLSFETKITVVNQAYNLDMDTNHPVATLQLAGKSLIEIDQIAGTSDTGNCLHAGIFMISFAHTHARNLSGPDGERVELMEIS